ncbi:TatD family hydrolase [Microgenomates group bacterium]|nr:TatD family hydrolase [Microgenomates group bacterium]
MSPLYENWQGYWQEAREAGVEKSLVAGADLETSWRAREMANEEESLLASGGFHPTFWLEREGRDFVLTEEKAREIVDEVKKGLKKMQEKKWEAVGECGLEYWKLTKREDWELIKATQQKVFALHLDWAKKSKLPLLLHMRGEDDGVYEDALAMIENADKSMACVWHCMGASSELVAKVGKLKNHYISLAGNVTFRNAKNLQELVGLIPKNRLLVETDAPYLTPVPYRGKWPNEPKNIVATVQFLADNFGVDPKTVYNNSERIMKKN